MQKGKELVKTTFILLIAKISTQVVNFLLLPMYTALLSTSEYGEIDIYSSLSMILIPFLTLQLENGLFRFFILSEDKDKKTIVSSSTVMVMLMTFIVGLIYLGICFILPVPRPIYVFFYYFSMMASTYILQFCRARGDNVGYGIGSFISSSLAVILNVVFIARLNMGVKGILLASIIAQLTCFVFLFFRSEIVKYLSFSSIKKDTCKSLLNYSIPLVFNQVSSWVINFSDRIIILNYLSIAINGIYAVANKFSNILNTFFGVFNIAWSENVIRSLNDPDYNEYVERMFSLIFQVYMIIVTGIVNLLPFAFGFLINEQYIEAYAHIPILLLAMFFSGMGATLGSVYIAYGKTKEVSVTTILAGLCNIIVHLSLLKLCGLYAASISTLVSFALLFFYRIYGMRKFFKVNVEWIKILIQTGIYIFAWIAYAIKMPIMIVIGLILNLTVLMFVIKRNISMIKDIAKLH